MKNDIKTMFSVISHEFRGPIASIQNSLCHLRPSYEKRVCKTRVEK
jgi:signal transduction histidine kinase